MALATLSGGGCTPPEGVESHRVTGNWMRPVMKSYDWVKIETKAYSELADVARGDIIVYHQKTGMQKLLCASRVLGLPGDRVQTVVTDVITNGHRLEHSDAQEGARTLSYAEHLDGKQYRVYYDATQRTDERRPLDVWVPNDKVMVHGDSRDYVAPFNSCIPNSKQTVGIDKIVGRKH